MQFLDLGMPSSMPSERRLRWSRMDVGGLAHLQAIEIKGYIIRPWALVDSDLAGTLSAKVIPKPLFAGAFSVSKPHVPCFDPHSVDS